MADDTSTRTRPRGSLTREEIIKEALALLEQEGPGALSMRRLADRLGVTPNALYTHVRGKADLIDGLIDEGYAGLPLNPHPPPPPPRSSPAPPSSPASAPTACGWAKPSTTSCGRPGSPTRPWSAPSM